jgi:hypothetical protein
MSQKLNPRIVEEGFMVTGFGEVSSSKKTLKVTATGQL